MCLIYEMKGKGEEDWEKGRRRERGAMIERRRFEVVKRGLFDFAHALDSWLLRPQFHPSVPWIFPFLFSLTLISPFPIVSLLLKDTTISIDLTSFHSHTDLTSREHATFRPFSSPLPETLRIQDWMTYPIRQPLRNIVSSLKINIKEPLNVVPKREPEGWSWSQRMKRSVRKRNECVLVLSLVTHALPADRSRTLPQSKPPFDGLKSSSPPSPRSSSCPPALSSFLLPPTQTPPKLSYCECSIKLFFC